MLQKQIELMDEAIDWAQAGLKNAPEGRLSTSTVAGRMRYYHRASTQEKTGTYLGAKDEGLIRALAQKDYELQLIKVAQREKVRLEKAQKILGVGNEDVLGAVYDGLSEARKKYVMPFELSDDEYAQQWQAREYDGNGHSFGGLNLYTNRGEQVRSKSEIIIANALEAAGVPYQYERPLNIGGYAPVYPDFTVLNKRTRREYIWEHLGAMGDHDYCEGALAKLNDYAMAGYLPGDRLLITYESGETPLDTRVVNEIIQRFLL